MRRAISRWGTLFLAVVLLMPACSRFGRGGPDTDLNPAPGAEINTGDHEADLRAAVRNYMDYTSSRASSGREEVIRKRPYWFRAYSVYTSEPSDARIVIQETESVTIPMVADVTVDKQRFSTRLHRKRAEAEQDYNFLRDTGEEVLSFEYRNGRWRRVGSVFVADKTEENINGEWVPLQEEVTRTIAAEERPGWFKRTWSWITGR